MSADRPALFLFHLNNTKMARIKYTALVEQIAGSIGGTTFQRNAYGYTIKSKPAIVNPATARQARSKTALQFSQNRWRSISDADRATWDTYAAAYPVPSRLNPDAYLGGQQLFIRWHNYGRLIGSTLDLIEDPPGTAEFTEYEIINSSGVLEVVGSWAGVSGTWHSLYFLSGKLTNTQNITKSKLRYIGNVAGANTSLVITTAYNEVFGYSYAVGERIGIQQVLLNLLTAQVIRGPRSVITVTA